MKENSMTRKMTAAVCTLAAVCSALAVYAAVDFAKDRERRDYYSGMYLSEMRSEAYRFLGAVENGDGGTAEAYHRARSAEEWARRAGEESAAVLFGKAAEADGDERVKYVRAVREYLTTGALSEVTSDKTADIPETDGGEHYDGRISAKKIKAARKTAEEIIGDGSSVVLTYSETESGMKFSCRNAYVIIDPRGGMPVEGALSLPERESVFGAAECGKAADGFIGRYCPSFTTVTPYETAREHGAYAMRYRTGAGELTILVDDSRARVVGFFTDERAI